jgi:monoamine oxidase
MHPSKRISRRKLLGTAAAAGVHLSLNRSVTVGFQRPGAGEFFDVAIVGAGLAGLTAARALTKSGINRIVVFDARDRVGGRTVNHDIGKGRVVEGGGQWVGPTQTAILSLCKELGVETFKTYLKGSLVYKAGGIRVEVPYGAAGEATTKLQKKIDALAAQVPLNAPWQAKKAVQWDAMTLEDWMRDEAVNAADRSTLSGAAALTLGTTPQRLSFLYFLYYVHSAGSLHDLESMGGGAQDSRIKGGSQILSLKMAKELADHVRLGEPVQRIRQNDKSVVVETTKGSIEAGQVVMALMPGSCTRIRFEPELPEARRQLQARWIQNEGGVKINVVYDRPFWRDRGLSGMSLSDAGPVPFTIDNTPPEGTPGVIMLFAESHELAKGSSARKQQIVNGLVGLFGKAAATPVAFYEMDWSAERYTAGCVSPLEPGVLTKYGAALRPRIGRIHWAGTETSEKWTGYMDGAIRSGLLAAKEVAKELAVR